MTTKRYDSQKNAEANRNKNNTIKAVRFENNYYTRLAETLKQHKLNFQQLVRKLVNDWLVENEYKLGDNMQLVSSMSSIPTGLFYIAGKFDGTEIKPTKIEKYTENGVEYFVLCCDLFQDNEFHVSIKFIEHEKENEKRIFTLEYFFQESYSGCYTPVMDWLGHEELIKKFEEWYVSILGRSYK